MTGNPSTGAPFVFNPYAYNGPYGSSATDTKATAIMSVGLGPWFLFGVPIAAWRINMGTWGSSVSTIVTFMQAGLKQLERASFSVEPEAEIPMFCVASGVSANFAMVPKFEESARKSPSEW